ncbi:MAG: hypothetical protein LBI83_18705 [Stenotrophomonas maltophilia]|jgi:hypothetical protein|nr:hypothetical protein [Stenotrophomonas maltophilia]
MSNDNKTLADVQPGGRVRLGDQLVLAKLVGAAGLMLAEIDTCGHEVDPAYRRTLYEAWEEGKAALSAQPSPGGQDAARYERLFISAVEMLTKISLHLGLEPNSDGVEPMLAAIDALAARQPVGEPVAWMTHHDEPMLFPTAAEAAAYCEDDEQPVPLYAAPPAQAVDHHAALLAEERAHGEIIDQRDRYHEVADELAARIAAITGVDIGEHSSANCPWQNAIEAAEEYQPAQAVDLGRFREAVEGLKDAALHDRDPGPAVNAYNRVLALIDGKAVGK